MWLLPRYPALSEVKDSLLSTAEVEDLIRRRLLHPKMLAYRVGLSPQPAVTYPELRSCFARHWPPTGDLMREDYSLSPELERDLRERIIQNGIDFEETQSTAILGGRNDRSPTPPPLLGANVNPAMETQKLSSGFPSMKKSNETDSNPDLTTVLPNRGDPNLPVPYKKGAGATLELAEFSELVLPPGMGQSLREILNEPPAEEQASASGKYVFTPEPTPDLDALRKRNAAKNANDSRTPGRHRVTVNLPAPAGREVIPGLTCGLIAGILLAIGAGVSGLAGSTLFRVSAPLVSEGLAGVISQMASMICCGGLVGLIGAQLDWMVRKEPVGPKRLGPSYLIACLVVGLATFWLVPGMHLVTAPGWSGATMQMAVTMALGVVATGLLRLLDAGAILPPESSPLSMLAFVVFFISLLAGPVVGAMTEIGSAATTSAAGQPVDVRPLEIAPDSLKQQWVLDKSQHQFKVSGTLRNTSFDPVTSWQVSIELLDDQDHVIETGIVSAANLPDGPLIRAQDTREFEYLFEKLPAMPQRVRATIVTQEISAPSPSPFGQPE